MKLTSRSYMSLVIVSLHSSDLLLCPATAFTTVVVFLFLHYCLLLHCIRCNLCLLLYYTSCCYLCLLLRVASCASCFSLPVMLLASCFLLLASCFLLLASCCQLCLLLLVVIYASFCFLPFIYASCFLSVMLLASCCQLCFLLLASC